MNKKSTLILVLFFALACSGFTRPNVYKIDAAKNAGAHNDSGMVAAHDGNYYEAIQEFCLAIALNPGTQATAVYYNNLGETYMKVGFYKEAQRCFEYSIIQYSLNFLYYQNLVKAIKAQNLTASKIKEYRTKSAKNPLSMIILGLLYVQSGDIRAGVIKLDEFCMREPDLIITSAVQNYLKQIAPKD